MPDADPIIQADLDAIDIPLAPRGSGNGDIGHIAHRRQEIQRDQGGQLAEVVGNYYAEETTYMQLRQQLQDIGYTGDHLERIAQATHNEQIYRSGHGGADSGLTPNQLDFLSRQGTGLLGRVVVQRDSRGVPLTYSSDIREEGGGRVNLPLPAGIPIEVLTDAQQDEIASIVPINQIVSEHLGNQLPTNPRPLNSFDRRQIDAITTQYFNNQIDLSQMADQLSTLYDIQNLRNNQQIITQIIEDTAYEKNYRDANNGRPSLLSEMQYQYLLNNPVEERIGRGITTQYNNQAIYVIPGTNTFYFSGGITNIPIPILNDDGTLAEDQDLTSGEIRRQLPRDLMLLGGPVSDVGLDTQNGIRPNGSQGLTPEEQNALASDTALLANGDIDFTGYLHLVDLKYSLSQRQFEDLITYVTAIPEVNINSEELPNVNNYSDRPLFIFTEGHQNLLMTEANYRTFGESLGRNQQQIDSDIEIQTAQWQRIHDIAVAQQFNFGMTGEEMAGRAPGGVGNLLGRLATDPDVTPDDVVQDFSQPTRLDPVTGNAVPPRTLDPALPVEPIQPITAGSQLPRPTITPEDLGPLPNIPTATGLGEPHDAPPQITITPSGQTVDELPIGQERFQPSLDENLQEYSREYESSQSLYIGFREAFNNILPSARDVFGTVGGFVGGAAVVSYYRSRRRGLIGEILSNERTLINQIEQRLTRLQNNLERRERDVEVLQDIGREQRDQGYRLLQRLNTERGILAGQEDDPDLPIPEQLEENVANAARELRNSNIVLRQIRRQIREAQEETERIALRITSETIIQARQDGELAGLRRNVANRLESLAQTDYRILETIQENFPQVLSGFTIGTALGGYLGGYLFPELVSVEDVENERIGSTGEKTPNENTGYEKSTIHPENKQDRDIMKNPFIISSDNKDIINPFATGEGLIDRSIYKKILPENFNTLVGIKANRMKGRVPTFREINELKSTLKPEELQRFKNKKLLFNPKTNKIDSYKTKNPCHSIIKTEIKGIDFNNNPMSRSYGLY